MRDNICPPMLTHCTYPIANGNGYYGYNPAISQIENKSNDCEMEVDSACSSQNVNIMTNNFQPCSRKRTSTEPPTEVQTCKRRRPNSNFQHVDSPVPRFGRKPTHHLPDIPHHIIYTFTQKESYAHMEKVTDEELLANIHGSTLHHWKREADF